MSGALGLATLENFMYVVIAGLTGSVADAIFTAVFRGLLAVPLHATTGTLIGVDIARNKGNIHHKNVLQVLLVPFILHAVYDFFIMFAVNYYQDHTTGWIFSLGLISVGAVLGGTIYAVRQVSRILQESQSYAVLNEELSDVVIS